MKIFHKNKKGFFTDPLVDLMGLIGVVVVIFIFTFIFSLIKASATFDINGVSAVSDAEINTLQLLKSPVIIDGYKTDIAGLIALTYNNTELNDRLDLEIKKVINTFYEKTNFYIINFAIVDYNLGFFDNLIGNNDFDVNTDASTNIEGINMGLTEEDYDTIIIEIPGIKPEVKHTIKVMYQMV